GLIVEHDDGMVEPGVFLVIGKRLDPFAVRHETGGAGSRNTPLVHTDPYPGGDMNAPARRVKFRIFTPGVKSSADRVDRLRHRHDASDLVGSYQQRFNHASIANVPSDTVAELSLAPEVSNPASKSIARGAGRRETRFDSEKQRQHIGSELLSVD